MTKCLQSLKKYTDDDCSTLLLENTFQINEKVHNSYKDINYRIKIYCIKIFKSLNNQKQVIGQINYILYTEIIKMGVVQKHLMTWSNSLDAIFSKRQQQKMNSLDGMQAKLCASVNNRGKKNYPRNEQ